MATEKTKTSHPCSPREFFERLYGHLEDSKNDNGQPQEDTKSVSELIAPIPMIPTPLPFFLNSGNEPPPHLSIAAAAGISAYCKYLFCSKKLIIKELIMIILFFGVIRLFQYVSFLTVESSTMKQYHSKYSLRVTLFSSFKLIINN